MTDQYNNLSSLLKLGTNSLMPNVSAEMLSADFWLNSQADIHKQLLSAQDISSLNQSMIAKGLINPLEESACSPDLIPALALKAITTLSEYQKLLSDKTLYDTNGNLINELLISSFYKLFQILDNPCFALTNNFAPERLLPSLLPFTEEAFDFEFDFLQNNGLDFSTLCLVVAETKDQHWSFQINTSSCGWIESHLLSPVSNTNYLKKLDKQYVNDKNISIFRDPECLQYHCTVRKGSSLLIKKNLSNQVYELFVSDEETEKSFFVKKEEITNSVLNLSLYNIYHSFFYFMHTPYGWGDSHQFIDCSKLIQLSFAVFGLKLPRNGISQGESGEKMVLDANMTDLKEKETLIIRHATPGLSFLRFPGHIMLYLGESKGKTYILHCLYKYREKIQEQIYDRIVNRVCITDLTPGRDSDRHSFLERCTQITTLKT